MPDMKNINRGLILPLMSVILLLSVYLTANVLLPLKAGDTAESREIREESIDHMSDDAGDGELVEMNIDLSDRCVVIDSGHGGADPGRVGSGDINEKDINLSIALKLKEMLEDAQVRVVMTRTSDSDLSEESDDNKKIADLRRRCDIINDSGADMVLSIHQNSYVTPNASGAQMFYYKNSEQGKEIAEGMQEILAEKLGTTRQIKADGSYYILRNTDVPTVIAECGFLSNPEEEALLVTSEYQTQVAEALYSGIMEYLISDEDNY